MKQKYKSDYFKQGELLLDILSFVKQHSCFCLKGGTAINLFLRDLPRLSVDIDLTYIPIKNRKDSLEEIDQTLASIKNEVEKSLSQTKVQTKMDDSGKYIIKLYASRNNHSIVVEPNTVLRGAVHPPLKIDLCKKAENLFKTSILDVLLLSKEDIYAGKICATLDRQHPRDLFDISVLYENEGLSNNIRKTFVIYLASSPRPMHELLSPNLQNISKQFNEEFKGMTTVQVSLDSLVKIRKKLIEDLNNNLTEKERNFLLSIKKGEPEWNLMPFENLSELPALKWKIINIQNMDNKKHSDQIIKLREILRL